MKIAAAPLPLASEADEEIVRMHAVLSRQMAEFVADRNPGVAVRRDRLDRAIAVLSDNRQAWCEALAEDFSCRSREESSLIEMLIPLENLHYARKHLRAMMAPERRATNFPFNILGGRSEIRFQPKGVVGNIVPWNIPILGLFGPLAAMLAAGNRVMVKMSEFAPVSGRLAQRLLAQAFRPDELAVFCGDGEVGAAFAALPFDHLMFTGSTRVGKLVMRAAADNLTPVTLELGGKSPVVVCEDADLALTARRIAWGKLVNGGQACIAPDYALVPHRNLDDFVKAVSTAMLRQFPDPMQDPALTGLINEAHLQRLQGYVDDARRHGAQVIPIAAPNPSAPSVGRKLMPMLIVNPSEQCRVMQEEIFGPILVVKSYETLDEAIRYINNRPHPLALYCFGGPQACARVIDNTCSGGIAVNDVITHAMQENLPFGGIGHSGMGAFHADYGFRSFSHARSVYCGTRKDPLSKLRPPYGAAARNTLDFLLRLRRR